MNGFYDYSYGVPSAVPDAVSGAMEIGIGLILGALLVLYLFLMLVAVAAYVFTSLSMYTIAKRRGIHKPWLAWIPVGNMWILGSISDQYQYVVKGQVRNRRKLMLGLSIASFGLGILQLVIQVINAVQMAVGNGGDYIGLGIGMMVFAVLIWIIAIVAAVIQYIAYYDLFRSCQPGNAVLYLVLSVVVSFAMPVLLFLCRNKDEGMPPRRKTPAPQVEAEPEIVPEPVPEEPAEEPVEPAEAPAEPEEPVKEPETTEE